MKKQNKKFAKVAAISALCTLGALSSKAIGFDANVYANFKDGIGADVSADVGVAQAKVGANVGLTGVEADVGADVFNMLDGTNSVEAIATKIAKDYDAPYETVEADVNKLIEKMRTHGLVEE
jgi:uncharacterized protein YdeI (BOF family)